MLIRKSRVGIDYIRAYEEYEKMMMYKSKIKEANATFVE